MWILLFFQFSHNLHAAPEFRYYMTMHGYQRNGILVPNAARFTHTWANFYKCKFGETNLNNCVQLTISWFSDTGSATLYSGVHPGKLYTHEESIALANRIGATIGDVCTYRAKQLNGKCAYEVTPSLWSLANEQHSKLKKLEASGTGYKMLSNVGSRSNLVAGCSGFLNCINAVADIAGLEGHSLLKTGTLRGLSASEAVLQYLLARYDIANTLTPHRIESSPEYTTGDQSLEEIKVGHVYTPVSSEKRTVHLPESAKFRVTEQNGVRSNSLEVGGKSFALETITETKQGTEFKYGDYTILKDGRGNITTKAPPSETHKIELSVRKTKFRESSEGWAVGDIYRPDSTGRTVKLPTQDSYFKVTEVNGVRSTDLVVSGVSHALDSEKTTENGSEFKYGDFIIRVDKQGNISSR